MSNTTATVSVAVAFTTRYVESKGADKMKVRAEATAKLQEMILAATPDTLAEVQELSAAIAAWAPATVEKVNQRPAMIAARVKTLQAALAALRADTDYDAALLSSASVDDKKRDTFASVASGTKAPQKSGGPAAYLAFAAEAKGTGTWTISQLRSAGKMDDGYQPSTGALATLLDSKRASDLPEGVTVGRTTEGTAAFIVA